jgi:hypothetical protein
MATIPVLLQNQQTCTTVVLTSYMQPTLPQKSPNLIFNQKVSPPYDVSQAITPRSRYWTSTTLEWLGIHQRGSVQYLCHDKSRRHRSKYSMENAVSESYEILLVWRFLRLGLHWDRRYPYGSFGLYPSTYPVLEYFSYDYDFRDHSVHEIQQKISSGALHPYARDEKGFSLLHVSKHSRTTTEYC